MSCPYEAPTNIQRLSSRAAMKTREQRETPPRARLAADGCVRAAEREEQHEVVRADLQPEVEEADRLLVLSQGEADAAQVHKVLGLALQ